MKRALLYLIPFAWLGPYLDWKEGSILGYVVFLFGLGVLSYSLARSGKPKHIVIGNIITFSISYGIALSLGEGYFKPLTASQLVVGLSVLNLVVQIPIAMNAIQNKVMKKELEGHDG